MRCQAVHVAVLGAILMAMPACAADDRHPQSILQERGPTVSVLLKSASSDAALASADVELLQPVMCQQAPCPPVVVWKGTTDRRGVVPIPRSHLQETVLLRISGYGAREAALSQFRTDTGAWTLYLVPHGAIVCGATGDEWTVRFARDRRSSEIREHGRALVYGVLTCSQEADAPLQCQNADVLDAGYLVRLSTVAGNMRVQIGAESKGGVRPLADTACRESR
jgi:hypothetical protein